MGSQSRSFKRYAGSIIDITEDACLQRPHSRRKISESYLVDLAATSTITPKIELVDEVIEPGPAKQLQRSCPPCVPYLIISINRDMAAEQREPADGIEQPMEEQVEGTQVAMSLNAAAANPDSCAAQAPAEKSAPISDLDLDNSPGLPQTQAAELLQEPPCASPSTHDRCRVGFFGHIAALMTGGRASPKHDQTPASPLPAPNGRAGAETAPGMHLSVGVPSRLPPLVCADAEGPDSAKSSADVVLGSETAQAGRPGAAADVVSQGGSQVNPWFKAFTAPSKSDASREPSADSGLSNSPTSPDMRAAAALDLPPDAAGPGSEGAARSQDNPGSAPVMAAAAIPAEVSAGASGSERGGVQSVATSVPDSEETISLIRIPRLAALAATRADGRGGAQAAAGSPDSSDTISALPAKASGDEGDSADRSAAGKASGGKLRGMAGGLKPRIRSPAQPLEPTQAEVCSPAQPVEVTQPRIRSPAQRLEPTWYGKKHAMTAAGNGVKNESPEEKVARRLRTSARGGLGGRISSKMRCLKTGKVMGRPRGKKQVARPESAPAAYARGLTGDDSSDEDTELDFGASAGTQERRGLGQRPGAEVLAQVAAAEPPEEEMEAVLEAAEATAEAGEAAAEAPKEANVGDAAGDSADEAAAAMVEDSVAAPEEAGPSVEAEEVASSSQTAVRVITSEDELDEDNDLVHQIYSEEVYGMLQRGLASSKRPLRADVSLLPVSHQIFPGDAERSAAEVQVREYFALSAGGKRAFMNERIETFVIPPTNTRHPAKRFQMNTLRHLGIRQEEKGLRAKKALPAWTLLGEYCGVLKTGEAAEEASCDCPIGFGGLRNDKLKDFCHSHPDRNTEDLGLWSEGQELVVDPAKSGNALRFINDCIGMPKGQTKSVAPVEVFDFATLRPHIFFFTVAPVKANQELLMDYGEQFWRFIDSEAKRAASLVSARKSVEELTAQVAELRKKVSEGAKKASGATKKTAGLTKQLANATRQLEEAEKAAFEAIEELQQANSAAADLRKQLHLERALHRSTRERLSEVEVKNTELRHKNAILKGLLEHHNIEYTC